MKILICGASGFIGKSLCARLAAEGHQIIRGQRRPQHPEDVLIDFSQPISAEWDTLLAGIDIVINAVGIIRESASARFADVHQAAPCALFDACVRAGVKRVIQISALGADSGMTPYFRSKYAADQHLMGLPIEWQILRPSLVYGEDGISASMFRTLASLPLIPVPALGEALFQPIHIDDLCAAVLASIEPDAQLGQCVELVGATRVSYPAMIETYRTAMGFSGGWQLSIPAPLMALNARIAGLIPSSPLSPDNWKMLQAGTSGDASALTRLIGRAPKSISAFIPAERSEILRQRALSSWRTPLLRGVLAAVWIATALISTVIYPLNASLELLGHVGISGTAALITLYAAAGLDLLMGVACLVWPRRALWLTQAVFIVGYSAIIALALPEYLIHPFGPLLKNLPMLTILFILFAEER